MFRKPVFTKHANRRLKKRGIGASRARRSLHGSKTNLGGGKYKSTSGGVTTVYKVKGGKKIVLTTYRDESRRGR